MDEIQEQIIQKYHVEYKSWLQVMKELDINTWYKLGYYRRKYNIGARSRTMASIKGWEKRRKKDGR